MNILKRFTAIVLLAAVAVTGAAFAGCGKKDDGNDGPAAHADAQGVVHKKGVCVSRYNASNIPNGQRIDDLNVAWWYNWGLRPTNEYITAEFVPMIWGGADVTAENLAYIEENYESGKFTHLLTFNEPDLKDQADMTVDEALELWPQLEETGIPLSSPAVSQYSAENGNAWLDEFMQKAEERGLRVDFIAIHLYQSFYTESQTDALADTLDALYEKYGLPVWLTEFGAIDIISRDSHATHVSPECNAQNAEKYIREATTVLEQRGFVERYSWFLDNFSQRGADREQLWEAVYTSLYNDDDSISRTGTAYKAVKSRQPLFPDTSALPECKRDADYDYTISVCGGTGDYTFTAEGLPEGLTLSASGRLSGKAKTSGIFPLMITITDSGKGTEKQSLTRKYVLTVS